MKTQLIAITALLAAFTATSASAITHKSGFIKSVDLDSNTVVLTLKSGREKEYRLAPDVRVVVDGKHESLNSLVPNQEVTIAISSNSPEYVRAKILEVDQATGVAVVETSGSKETITILVDETTKIGGKISSKEQLSEGQTIKLRHAAQL